MEFRIKKIVMIFISNKERGLEFSSNEWLEMKCHWKSIESRLFNDRIFEIPTHDYPMGRLGGFLTIAICNENEMPKSIESSRKMLERMNTHVITHAPGNCAFFRCCCCLIGLTFDTKIHNMVSTYRTIIHHDIPRP